jgi:hypothetical protein
MHFYYYFGLFNTRFHRRSHKERTIESGERMIKQENNPIVNKYFELQIKMLQNAPRDVGKLQHALVQDKEEEVSN